MGRREPAAHPIRWSGSLQHSAFGATQAVEPDRGADGGNVFPRAKQSQQAIVASAADHGVIAAAALMTRLENKAGIIIEIAGKFRRERQGQKIDAACGDETEPRVEFVERLRAI